MSATRTRRMFGRLGAVLAGAALTVGTYAGAAIADVPVAELPARIGGELDIFRHAADDAAAGHPVRYGDGQCYALVKKYINELGYGWENYDPSPNTSDLYNHYPTNGLSQYFDRIPAAGGATPPQIGDIVVYGPGAFVGHNGHAGVVSAIGDHGWYEVAEQNFNDQLFVTEDWRDFNPGWNTLGYLRPRA